MEFPSKLVNAEIVNGQVRLVHVCLLFLFLIQDTTVSMIVKKTRYIEFSKQRVIKKVS